MPRTAAEAIDWAFEEVAETVGGLIYREGMTARAAWALCSEIGSIWAEEHERLGGLPDLNPKIPRRASDIHPAPTWLLQVIRHHRSKREDVQGLVEDLIAPHGGDPPR